MRNWNIPWFYQGFRRSELPDYLWGIETFLQVLKMTLFGLASRLPMRNWNLCQAIVAPLQKASRLPMRNWNYSCRGLDVRGGGCQLPDYLWGIETHFLHKPMYHREQSFQTTYEELKPVAPKSTASLIPASRLPMRNWNSRLLLWIRQRAWLLPDYLWGIETLNH